MTHRKACEVSIIVVSYNTRDLTLSCLASVYEETQTKSFEVIVVDNASSDGSLEAIGSLFPDVRLIANDINLGFAAANNLAAMTARGRYILLLNPDTVVLDRAIDKLVQFADAHVEYGVYGGRTIFPDGTLNPSSCWRKPGIWNAFCRSSGLSALARQSAFLSSDVYAGWLRDDVREIDLVSGCLLLIHTKLWHELGGFDTSYFMYGEDWDLCLRARAHGARCIFCPDVEIVHYGGASEPVRSDKLVRLLSTKVKLYFEHWGVFHGRVLVLLLWLWVIRSLVVDAILGRFGNRKRRGTAAVWREVCRRHDEWSR